MYSTSSALKASYRRRDLHRPQGHIKWPSYEADQKGIDSVLIHRINTDFLLPQMNTDFLDADFAGYAEIFRHGFISYCVMRISYVVGGVRQGWESSVAGRLSPVKQREKVY